jgi:hypothetical protein
MPGAVLWVHLNQHQEKILVVVLHSGLECVFQGF